MSKLAPYHKGLKDKKREANQCLCGEISVNLHSNL